MNIAFLMDPLESVKPHKDTTYFLMLAAYEQGHTVFYFNQSSLQVTNGKVEATLDLLEVYDSHELPFSVRDQLKTNLNNIDVVVIRTDPPFDRRYLYSTLLLDLIGKQALVVNRPSGVRNWNEKLAALFYPDHTPATLVSSQIDELMEFVERYGRVTLKPIDGHGGKGILFVDRGGESTKESITQMTHNGGRWIIAQQYLRAASEGDKRILIVEGEPIGAVLRVHASGQELNNLDQGGEAVPAELDAGDLALCAAMKPELIEQGIFFCGIDIIGGKLIEINVTSPTCLQELCRFSGIDHHHNIIKQLVRQAEG